ncbi:UvrD-helicase domain-containing protein [Thermus sp.]|uniref:ATP-dependent helicase n=1 Tax=Thermus sp. TaxID=275 RepID=UPI0033333766
MDASLDDLLAPLNEAQRQAVLHFEGPALVVAGAGSGKTRTVVHRVAYLLRHRGVYPTEVLAVTFTNKAANELKERLVHLVGPAAKEVWAATFHSAALRVLRAYGEHLGLRPGFVIFDEEDQETLLKEVLKEMGLEARPGPIKAFLDRAKNSGKPLEAFFQEAPEYVAGLPKERLRALLARYQEVLRAQGAVDFGDLLLLALELFERHPEVLKKVRQRARFIHVDEYQDTNPVQYRFIRLLADEKTPNLVAVGDPDQSIYGFRAADIRNILDFTRDFPGAKIYRLEENYRSTEAILRLANAIIAQNQARLEKTLRPLRKGGEPVRLFEATTAREEAQFVAQEVARLGPPYDRYAVLYRTNAQSRLLEEALRLSGIPAQVVGGVGFFERAEVKDLLAYARLAVNPLDALAFRRAVKTPPRGLGQTTLEMIQSMDLPPLEALRALPLKGGQARSKEAFLRLMEELSALVEGPAEAFFRHLLSATDYLAYLEGAYRDHLDRRENVEELLRAAKEAGSVQAFLDRVALTASADQEAASPAGEHRAASPAGEHREKAGLSGKVRLMTLHNAKGLEFPVVFLVGLEENLLPHRNSLARLEDLEEERRLFYVGVTRAKERLYLSYALEREVFGKREYTRMSRFLEEIPKGLYEAYDPRPASPGLPPPPSRREDPEGVFKGGERVYHPKFGPGRVVAARGEEVTVHFEGIGLKKLHLRFADLRPL